MSSMDNREPVERISEDAGHLDRRWEPPWIWMPFICAGTAFGIYHYNGVPSLWYIFGVVAVSAVGLAPFFKRRD